MAVLRARTAIRDKVGVRDTVAAPAASIRMASATHRFEANLAGPAHVPVAHTAHTVQVVACAEVV